MTSIAKQSRVFGIEKTTGIDGLTLGAAPIPTPGPGQVVVHVRASSLNYRDLIILNGHYYMPIPTGRIPLSDGAGEIAVVGPGVTRFTVGDHVANTFFPDWIDGPYPPTGTHRYRPVSGRRCRTPGPIWYLWRRRLFVVGCEDRQAL